MVPSAHGTRSTERPLPMFLSLQPSATIGTSTALNVYPRLDHITTTSNNNNNNNNININNYYYELSTSQPD